MASPASVAVIIAAKNAAPWIDKAVASALAEPETGEVWVVDDGSTDGTADVARRADDASGRLQILRNERSLGPSGARNRVLDRTRLPFCAVLDADDMIRPGRFASLFAAGDDWDFLCDNILLVPEAVAGEVDPAAYPVARPTAMRRVDAEAFVRGNVSSGVFNRSELGFLKPVFRRSFLAEHGLRYDSAMMLGEDYALYVRALMAGARFVVADTVGYHALMRGQSISSQHGQEDLARLGAFDDAMIRAAASPGLVKALRLHRLQVLGKARHRAILETGQRQGKVAAVLDLLSEPVHIPYILKVTGQLKWRSAQGRLAARALVGHHPSAAPIIRTLLDPAFFREG